MQENFTRHISLAALAALAVACGSSDEEGTTESPDPPVNPDVTTDDPPMEPVSPLLEGALIGTDGTMPCDPGPETDYAGDELCILPPVDGTGIQLHAGPKDYDDPDDVGQFLIGAGEENTEYYGMNSPNTDTIFFYQQHFRMRPGSHHLIIMQQPESVVEGWQSNPANVPIGGTQLSAMDYPPGGIVPPEDEDLVRPLLANQGFAFQMHYVNATDEPILREVWVNLMVRETDNPLVLGAPFMEGKNFSIPPRAQQTLNYTCEMTQPDMRIVSIFGHRHANTDRFSVWVHRGGERTLVYEDYDWAESAEIFYNSIQENPDPDPALGIAGGYSGLLELQTGDSIEWECEVNNRQDVTLTYGDAAYTGEMCNVFGTSHTTGFPIWYCAPQPTVY